MTATWLRVLGKVLVQNPSLRDSADSQGIDLIRLYRCGLGQPADLDAAELRVMTIEMQAIERELIRFGYLPPEDRVERQLECLVRSPEWWRRNRAKPNGSDSAIKSHQRLERAAQGLEPAARGCCVTARVRFYSQGQRSKSERYRDKGGPLCI